MRRGQNIYKRKDGRWEARYIKDRDEHNKIIYGSIYGKTYREAKQKVSEISIPKKEKKIERNIRQVEFAEWVEDWMQSKVRYEVKKTTYSNYLRLIKKHIITNFKGKKLNEIERSDVQEFINSLQKSKLSSGTISNIFSLLKKIFFEAKENGIIFSNPTKSVITPKVKKNEVKVLSLAQQKKLEEQAKEERGCSPIILSLYSGMRIGEISGLKWSDIDFENNIITVNRTVSRIVNEDNSKSKTKIIEDTPKSLGSSRKIPLAPNLKEYLLEHKKISNAEYVINLNKELVEPRTIAYRFKNQVSQAGLKDINFHILRHTFATRCLEKRVDIASLSKILGHQSVKMTLDTYGGSLFETRVNAMNSIDELFYLKF